MRLTSVPSPTLFLLLALPFLSTWPSHSQLVPQAQDKPLSTACSEYSGLHSLPFPGLLALRPNHFIKAGFLIASRRRDYEAQGGQRLPPIFCLSVPTPKGLH